MLFDILNSIIYLLAAQLLQLGGCLAAGIKLYGRYDPEVLEWVGHYYRKHYDPYRGGKWPISYFSSK